MKSEQMIHRARDMLPAMLMVAIIIGQLIRRRPFPGMSTLKETPKPRAFSLRDGVLAVIGISLLPATIASLALTIWTPFLLAIDRASAEYLIKKIAVPLPFLPGTVRLWLTCLIAFAMLATIEKQAIRRVLCRPRLIAKWPELFDNERVLLRRPERPNIALYGYLLDNHRVRTEKLARQLQDQRPWANAASNWNDACAQLREMDPGEAREIEKAIRSMIEHENTLMNNRIQWFLTITGFIITSLFLSSRIGTGGLLVVFLATLGFVVSISFWLSLRIGGEAVQSLINRWEGYRTRAVPYFNEVGVIGSLLGRNPLSLLVPWRVLPPVLIVFWGAIICLALASPNDFRVLAPGTFVHLEKSKVTQDNKYSTGIPCPKRHFLLDTATGDLKCVDIKNAAP
jgi:hypothetical protein